MLQVLAALDVEAHGRVIVGMMVMLPLVKVMVVVLLLGILLLMVVVVMHVLKRLRGRRVERP